MLVTHSGTMTCSGLAVIALQVSSLNGHQRRVVHAHPTLSNVRMTFSATTWLEHIFQSARKLS